jgi:hypothetical protein
MSASAHPPRAHTHARIFWAGALCLLLGVLIIARMLEPNPAGLGTHVQLGLPACAFLVLTDWPCPSCGLTTAFAYMSRGDLGSAMRANVVGVPLFLCVIAAVPACIVACSRRAPVGASLKRLRLERVTAIIGLTAVLSWLARLVASQ